jgi:hypothetical protein
MNGKPVDHFPLLTDKDIRVYVSLEDQLELGNAIKICSVPLRFTRSLVSKLLKDFASNIDEADFWSLLNYSGLVIQRDEDEWRLCRKARQYFLNKLEEDNPALAKRAHKAMLDHLTATASAMRDEDQFLLQQAYHITPSDQDEGASSYWSTYCRIRSSNRFAMLPVLAHLVESQTRWLTNYGISTKLYRAAALYYEGSIKGKQQAADILEEILGQDAPVHIMIDAGFLLGMLKEQVDQNEAVQLYTDAASWSDALSLAGQSTDAQYHLRLTLAKSFFNLARILQDKDGSQALDKAEQYYRYGIQIVSGIDPGYEATQLRHLIGILQRRGEQDQVKDFVQRVNQIEGSLRQTFLKDALSKVDDIDNLYYAISALNHGLGYDNQLLEIEVEPDGATRLVGTYTLKATSALEKTDFHLETVPESKKGVHFESLESLTPAFSLSYRRLDSSSSEEVERREMTIDPPMQPGDQLAYRWTASSSPGTIATTPQELEDAGLDYEYVFWDIIVPMRQMEIQVVIPWEHARPYPPVWYDIWRAAPSHAHTQAQAAYRACLEDSPGRVLLNIEAIPPDKLRLSLQISYPLLAVRYVLAWGIESASRSQADWQ